MSATSRPSSRNSRRRTRAIPIEMLDPRIQFVGFDDLLALATNYNGGAASSVDSSIFSGKVTKHGELTIRIADVKDHSSITSRGNIVVRRAGKFIEATAETSA